MKIMHSLGGLMGSPASMMSMFDPTGVLSNLEAGAASARAANEQAAVIEEETRQEAKNLKRENKKFSASQELGFLSSGVILEGSPLQILEQDADLMTEDVANLRKSGYANARAVRAGGQAAARQGVSTAVQSGSRFFLTAGLKGSSGSSGGKNG